MGTLVFIALLSLLALYHVISSARWRGMTTSRLKEIQSRLPIPDRPKPDTLAKAAVPAAPSELIAATREMGKSAAAIVAELKRNRDAVERGFADVDRAQSRIAGELNGMDRIARNVDDIGETLSEIRFVLKHPDTGAKEILSGISDLSSALRAIEVKVGGAGSPRELQEIVSILHRMDPTSRYWGNREDQP